MAGPTFDETKVGKLTIEIDGELPIKKTLGHERLTAAALVEEATIEGPDGKPVKRLSLDQAKAFLKPPYAQQAGGVIFSIEDAA